MMRWLPPVRRHPRRWLLGTGAIVIVVALLAGEQLRRNGLYWHDVRRDHSYAFSDAEVIPVTLETEGFVLPDLPEDAHSVLLRMDLKSTLAGKWFEPAVEVQGPSDARVVQYLARGARGTRHINLSHVLESTDPPGSRVELKGQHVGWERQPAVILVFERPQLEEGPLLVLAPHPDDAEIAAFGLYSETDSWVVTVSSGNGIDRRMAGLVADPAARSRLKGELRSWDSVAVPLWGGVPANRVANLGYFTQSLAEMYSAPSQTVADPLLESSDIRPFRRAGAPGLLEGTVPRSTWNSLVADLVAVLETVRPRTVVTPHPGLDAAPDHKLTTVALMQALAQLPPEPRNLLLYTNHHVTSEYFPFGPADGVVSPPPWTEAPLELGAVYSHPLDGSMRIRKLYALEAQHDLRPAPAYVGADPARRIWGELGGALTRIWRDPTDTYSYLRRGPRPNELFFVLSAERALGLDLERFVGTPKTRDADFEADYSP